MGLDRVKLIEVAKARLYSPYRLGAKWALDNLNPQGPVDCSGFVRWCYWRAGLTIRDGSEQQFEDTDLTTSPLPGDLGFFRKDGLIHHVGIYNSADVIEARGEPYNQVILRPSAKWETFDQFTGWRRIKGV